MSDDKSESSRKDSFNEVVEHPLAFSRNNKNNQIIKFSVTSPFKELLNEKIDLIDKMNKKLRTPSSKKGKTLKKKNDVLPSVSPLLKKLLAKEDTYRKINTSNSKDSLNVALFHD